MRFIFSFLILIFMGSVAFAQTHIKNATIITMTDQGMIENADLIIDGNRILYIGNGPLPPSVQTVTINQTIDGMGKFIVPGLSEMHGHLPTRRWSQERRDRVLFLYLAGGITTVRGMLGDDIQFSIREQITAGELDGPMLYLAAPSLNGNTVSSPEEGREKVKRYASQGWDLQKIHPGLTRAEYDAIVEEANTHGFPFGGHVPADVGLKRALEAGQISIDHLDGYLEQFDGTKKLLTNTELQQAVDITLASGGTWIIPTQALFNLFLGGGDIETLMARPENKYVPNHILKRWRGNLKNTNQKTNPIAVENRQRLLKALADANANIALGSDAPQFLSVPGFSIWREILEMKKAGLTADQILTIGTVNPGRYFADKDKFGTLTAGARADLILLNNNPYEKIENLFDQAGVMAAGKWYSRAAIDERLATIASTLAQ
jgi:imidazolonepropionase-like amidohydrolase